MSRAYLALGANIGEPRKQLMEAMRRLDEYPDIHVVKLSSIIETEPWGNPDQPRFLNMVVAVDTAMPPDDLMQACLAIERGMGRVRAEKWGPRVIDIDIIAVGETQLTSETVTLPHPHAHQRAFVMDPLREIAPDVAEWIAAEATARNTQTAG
ncbi:MAG TPA: 2-amino-4-hydroxy-6-hydroxymethyldihydropteridine diphosphokinase [Devosiaceae bacterium]|nr:2-amino-4-hydroxy-6-hydroxymethyldihydropteridine diphosphokinase [Devosiaceae bacterium]